MELETPLMARHPDGVLRVIMPSRISNLHEVDDAQAASEAWLRSLHLGPMEIHRVCARANGGFAIRAAYNRVRAMIEREQIDLVIVNEIRDLTRDPRHLWSFLQRCIDRGTRMIVRVYSIDTGREGWEEALLIAVQRDGLPVRAYRRSERPKFSAK